MPLISRCNKGTSRGNE